MISTKTVLATILGFYDPAYTSNGLTKLQVTQMIHDIGAAAYEIWKWWHS